MQIRKVTQPSLLRNCRRFLGQDPVANVLPLGDLYAPLFQASDIYAAVQGSRVVGVCVVFRAYSKPSIVFGAEAPEIKHALIDRALSENGDEFISLCSFDDAPLFKKSVAVLHSHVEQQMIASSVRKVECGGFRVEKVGRNELEFLDKFYVEHHAEAWTPIQFKAGPYYCVKKDGKIVSAAGVHLVTPQIAQLGNIFTDKAYRSRGYATASTSRLTADLASEGRIISLLVRINNIPAVRMYEKLGFRKEREIVFLVLRKKKK